MPGLLPSPDQAAREPEPSSTPLITAREYQGKYYGPVFRDSSS
jgi:hypothetical protein